MAVAPTGNIFKSLEFDGESSKGYGVYITGAAVYNAPEREVEMITIPGRNGSFALDHGRFQNIEVTYPAGIFADNELDFAQAVSDFRNFLCSKKGYCRLTDDYNPDEYRMAIYKSGLEVTPATLTAGQFNITFECKPQRFLTSGETAVSVASGDTISNPTLFESSPMLEVTGYGDININDEQITTQIVELGEISLSTPKNKQTVSLSNLSMLNTGDAIYPANNPRLRVFPRFKDEARRRNFSHVSFSDITGSVSYVDPTINIELSPIRFAKGTANTYNGSVSVSFYFSGGMSTLTGTFSVSLSYDGNDRISFGFTTSGFSASVVEIIVETYYQPTYYGDSSQQANPDPTYIDLDVGEVYGYINGTLMLLNSTAILPADLPTIKPGTNTITYSNTVTALKVVPRWWKI